MKRNTKGIMMLAVLAVFGFSTIALAGWGDGYGHMMGPGMMGPGWQQRLQLYSVQSSGALH